MQKQFYTLNFGPFIHSKYISYLRCTGSPRTLQFFTLGVRDTSTSMKTGTSLSRSVSSSQESFLTVLGIEPRGHSILPELSKMFDLSSSWSSSLCCGGSPEVLMSGRDCSSDGVTLLLLVLDDLIPLPDTVATLLPVLSRDV